MRMLQRTAATPLSHRDVALKPASAEGVVKTITCRTSVIGLDSGH
jgi:hypothetical protein